MTGVHPLYLLFPCFYHLCAYFNFRRLFSHNNVQMSQNYVKGGLVMVSELSDEHRVIAYLVDEAMLIIDAPRPVAG